MSKLKIEYMSTDELKPYDKEYGARALARKFNVSPYPIMQIAHGKGWKHIQ